MNGNRGLVIATAAAFIVGCSVGLMGGILFARYSLPGPPMFGRMHGPPGPGGGRGGPRGEGGMIPMLVRSLDLTAAQRDSLVAIMDRARRGREAARDSMEAEFSRVLTPQQRARWKQMEDQFEHSRRHSRRPRGEAPPIGIRYPDPGERNNEMRTNWWTMGVAALMSMAPIATASAQEAPPPPPRETMGAHDPEWAPEDDGDVLSALDEDVPPEPGGGSGPGEARRGEGMRRGPGMRGGDRMAMRERLDLSDDQRKRLADIRDRHQRQVIPIQADLKVASLDLRKLVQADRPDTRAINAQIDRIAALRATMQKSRVSGMIEARNVLTPAQQKIMREHGGPGMHMGGPGRHMDGRRMMKTQ